MPTYFISTIQSTKLLQNGFLNGVGGLLNAGPTIDGSNDGRFLPFFLLDSPLNLMKKNKLPIIPMLTGVNKLETKTEILGKQFYLHIRLEISGDDHEV